MKKLLILGAGRSAAALIDYLSKQPFHVLIVDVDQATIKHYEERYKRVEARQLDIFNVEERDRLILESDLVISMLPAFLHIHVATSCIKLKKHLLTASYVDEEVKRLEKEIDEAGVLFLYECGLDPGLDHMSAMRMIDDISSEGGKITVFVSRAGGLMAPGSDNNPWRYKFTWNPRNVVMAGKNGIAQYMYNGILKTIPHHQLFKRLSLIEIPEYGTFESYPNRDSLKYKSLYGLQDIQTLLRGTLRRPGFSTAWNCLVQLGLTDDSYPVKNIEKLTYAQFTRSYLPFSRDDLKTNFSRYLGVDISSEVMERLTWLGIFNHEPIGLKKATPAQVIQHLLERKWKAEPTDEDMIVMQHDIHYVLNDKKWHRTSYMVKTGRMSELSGMAQTVGYPLGIAAKLLLSDQLTLRGLHIPTKKEIYEPILLELSAMNIDFIEELKERKKTEH